MSNYLQPHGLLYARLPSPSPTPGACLNFHWVSDAIQPYCPLSSSSPPAFNLSQHQGFFKWNSSSHQVAKLLEFQFQYQSLKWIFKTDLLQNGLLNLLAVQGTLKSLLQHHSSKASILWHSAFFIVHTWKLKLLSRVRLFSTPWTIQSMEFSRPEYCSG